MKILTKAVQKRDYYYTSPYGSRMFQLGLGPAALSLVGVAGIDNTRQIQALQRLHGENWTEHWMQENGVDDQVIQLLGRYRREADSYLRERFVMA